VSIEDDIKKNSSQILQTIEDNKNKIAFAPSDTQNLFEDYKSRPNLISILKPESQHEKVLIQRESLSPVHQPNKSFGRENHESRKDLFSPEILGGDSKIDRFHRRTITESPVFSHKFTNGNDTRTKPPVKRIGVNEYSSKYKKTTQFPQKEVLNINSTFHQRKASPVYEMRKTQYVNESNNKSSFS